MKRLDSSQELMINLAIITLGLPFPVFGVIAGVSFAFYCYFASSK